jgi:hypothetical protein
MKIQLKITGFTGFFDKRLANSGFSCKIREMRDGAV